MPIGWAVSIVTTEQTGLAIAALVILAAAAVIARGFFRRKPAPEEIERQRRLQIHREGKLGDGEIIDVDPEMPSLIYEYSVAGVGYSVAQDLGTLRHMLPEDLMTMLGPVSIKFNPHNPANSIVLCEEWNGLRQKPHPGVSPRKP
jgi:hypothetical protein